jgi:hypothetical protein
MSQRSAPLQSQIRCSRKDRPCRAHSAVRIRGILWLRVARTSEVGLRALHLRAMQTWKTMSLLLHLPSRVARGSPGRVLEESLCGYQDTEPRVRRHEIVSRATSEGLTTEVHLQSVGSTMYFDAAGGPGWTVGIALRPAPCEWRPWMWDWSVLNRVKVSLSPEDPKV